MLFACGNKTFDVPAVYEEQQEQADIYPDYKDIIVPENIAPINFMVDGMEGLVVTFEGKGNKLTVSGIDRIDIDTTQWRSLLKENAGAEVQVTVSPSGSGEGLADVFKSLVKINKE